MSLFKIDIDNVLDRVGKKVGLNLISLIKNGKWIVLKFALLAFGGWLLSLLFARLGTKELLGQYQYVLSVITLVSICSLPGLNTAALEAVAKGREAGVVKAVKLSALFSVVGLLVLLGVGFYTIFFKNELLLGEVFLLAAVLCPFYYALNTWNIYYDGKSLFKESALRTIILNIILTSSLVLGLLFKFNLVALILVYLLVNILFFGYYFLEILKKIKDFSNDAIDLAFGVNSSIQRFVFSLSNNVPSLAISALFGIEAVAVYYVGYYMISAGSSLMGMFGYLYIPTLFKGGRLNHRNIILQNIVIGIVLWVAFVLFIKYFFTMMYGTGYMESREMAFRLSFIMLLVPLKTFLMNFFLTSKKNWMIIAIVIVANIISVTLFYLGKERDLLTSVTVYIYALELMTTLPLFFVYMKENFSNIVLVKNKI